MEENKTNVEPKRIPYKKHWWFWFCAFVVFLLLTMFLPTTYTQVQMFLFLATMTMSIMLGIHSLIYFKKMPKGMTFVGIFQSCIFGFYFLGTTVLAWLIKLIN